MSEKPLASDNTLEILEEVVNLWMCIELYFIGKAFFVGPMLLIAARAVGPKEA